MTMLSEYDGIKPSILDYQPYDITIETISGLLLQFYSVEEENIRNGVIYHYFKKSLWGRKQIGFLKMEYLPGNHIAELLVTESEPVQPYSDIVLGIEYGSLNSAVNWAAQSSTYYIQAPNKQVLSYGILLSNIEAKIAIHRQLYSDEFVNAGSIMMLDPSRMNYISQNIDLLDRVKSTLNVFNKFLADSMYQPVADE